jgi:hypothetical protein
MVHYNIFLKLYKGGVMPRGDRTGPAGMGPMTGRAAGYCTGNAYPGFMSPHPPRFSGRRGFGRMGMRRGYRHGYYNTGMPGWSQYEAGYPAWGGYTAPGAYDPYMSEEIAPEQEKDVLLEQAEMLKQHIIEVEARLNELEKDSKPVSKKGQNTGDPKKS